MNTMLWFHMYTIKISVFYPWLHSHSFCIVLFLFFLLLQCLASGYKFCLSSILCKLMFFLKIIFLKFGEGCVVLTALRWRYLLLIVRLWFLEYCPDVLIQLSTVTLRQKYGFFLLVNYSVLVSDKLFLES